MAAASGGEAGVAGRTGCPQEPQKVAPSRIPAPQWGQRPGAGGPGGTTADGIPAGGIAGGAGAARFTAWPQEPQKVAPSGNAAPHWEQRVWPPGGDAAGGGDHGDGTAPTAAGSGRGETAGDAGAAARGAWPQEPQKPAVSSTAAPQWGQAISMDFSISPPSTGPWPPPPAWSRNCYHLLLR